MKPIALDAMGGDNMPAAAVEGALVAAQGGVEAVLVGDESRLKAELARLGGDLDIVHAPDAIGMEEHATDVRRRKQSSVMLAMSLVKEGEASACVSMGHSGATMAAALLVLGRLPGVERPAIAASIPTRRGVSVLLDAGANADSRPVHLQQFAVMGSVFCRALLGIAQPRVGLMSIGEEAEKGNELTRQAHELLAVTSAIDFYGNVEGRDLLKGTTDVVVTDGFTGNVVLKLAEGEARELFSWVREALLGSGPLVKLGAALVKPALRKVANRLDPAEYGAQPLLGVRGNAFIGHGSSDARAVASALRTAARAVRQDLTGRIAEGMAQVAEAGTPGA
ncbi:MAG TPA: phosphate acyltransferase PlsX [Trueperaceae bacterium]